MSGWEYPGKSKLDHTIRDLIHFIPDGPCTKFGSSYKETVGGSKPTSETWYTGTDKTKKIVEHSMIWNGNRVAQETWVVYDTNGVTPLSSITDVITYAGNNEVSRVRTVSGF